MARCYTEQEDGYCLCPVYGQGGVWSAIMSQPEEELVDPTVVGFTLGIYV